MGPVEAAPPPYAELPQVWSPQPALIPPGPVATLRGAPFQGSVVFMWR
jgi:hypothetical protein